VPGKETRQREIRNFLIKSEIACGFSRKFSISGPARKDRASRLILTLKVRFVEHGRAGVGRLRSPRPLRLEDFARAVKMVLTVRFDLIYSLS